MAFTSREMQVSSAAAFGVLVDPETYPRWLVGAAAIREVDDDWPVPGAGSTIASVSGRRSSPITPEVLDIEQDTMLRLRVRARPFITAVATFRVVGSADRCVVTLEEEPGRAPRRQPRPAR